MMKNYFVVIILSLFLAACTQPQEKESASIPVVSIEKLEVPPNTIDKSLLNYNNKNSLWTLSGEKFSGYAVSYYPDGTLSQKMGILDGKKQDRIIDWFPDGQMKHSAHYHQGKLHGEKKTWSSDSSHHILSHLNYHLTKAHGTQRLWYTSGEVYKIMQLNMGKEEGLQKAYRKNGVLYANYEAIAGRNFGIKRAALCFELDNENVVYSK